MPHESDRQRRGFGAETAEQVGAGYVSRGARAAIRSWLDSLRTGGSRAQYWWNVGAWLYLEASVNARESFEFAFRTVTSGLAELIHRFVKIPLLHEMLEVPVSVMATELADYFRDQEDKWQRPLDFKEPKVGDIPALFKEMWDDFLHNFGFLSQLQSMLLHLLLLDDVKGNTYERFVKSLYGLGKKYVRAFNKFYKKLDEAEQGRFKQNVRFLDEPGELKSFLDLPIDDQLKLFRVYLMFKRPELWPKLVKFAKENWPVIEEIIHRGLVAANAFISDMEEALARNNTERFEVLAQRLQDNRQTRERRRRQTATPGWPVLVFAGAALVISLISAGVNSCKRSQDRPVVIVEAAETVPVRDTVFASAAAGQIIDPAALEPCDSLEVIPDRQR